jgi:hypothetical protein
MPGPFLAPAKAPVDRLIARFQQAEVRLGMKETSVGTATVAVAATAAAPAPEQHGALPEVPVVPAVPAGGIH